MGYTREPPEGPLIQDSWQWWIVRVHPKDRGRTVSGLQQATVLTVS
jgi:hypothetical protein